MDWNLKKIGPTVALTMIAASGFAADRSDRDRTNDRMNQQMQACQPMPPAPCYSLDTPPCDYCLGPENVAANPSVRPITCNGDFIIQISGFYWNANQDGLEYAIENSVVPTGTTPPLTAVLNNLIDAKYLNPKSKWDWGFKLGAGWGSTHDGWDIMAIWTHFKNRSSQEVTDQIADNQVLMPLWSAFAAGSGNPNLWATTIDNSWEMKLDLVDIELGREFWSSKYLTLRPHVGVRISWIKQNFELNHRGGSWTDTQVTTNVFNNEVDLKNDFKGVGVRAGLDSTWIVGRGFAFFGNAAISIVYGRFSIEHEEENRIVASPFTATPILETSESFRSSKAMTDLALGIEWSTLFNSCQYGFTIALAWEHHMFFNQNQLWRVNRIGDTTQTGVLPNNTGENVFIQRRGDLSTQGWTLTAVFEF